MPYFSVLHTVLNCLQLGDKESHFYSLAFGQAEASIY